MLMMPKPDWLSRPAGPISSAVDSSFCLIASGPQLEQTLFIRAAAPVTWGDAMEVPDKVLYDLLRYVERMSTPGALTATCGPCEEKLAMVSF